MNLNEFIAEAIDGEQTGIRFLQFRTDRLSLQEAQKVVSAIGQYNGFEPEKVNQALGELAGKFGRLRIEVGREYSPCLYVNVPYDLGEGREEAREHIKLILAEAGPDELDDWLNGYQVRAWWD